MMSDSKTQHTIVYISIAVTLLFLFYMVILPWQPTNFIKITPYDFRRLSQIFLLVFYPLMTIFSITARGYVFETWHSFGKTTKTLILLFFILGLLSSAFSIAPLQGLLFVSQYFLLFIMALYIAGLCKVFPNTLRFILYGIIIISTVYALLTLLNYFFIKLDNTQHDHAFILSQIIYPEFMNIRFLNQYITWVLPLLIWPLLQKNSNKKLCVFIILLTTYWWYLAIASESRSVPAVWITVFFISAILYRQKSLYFLSWQLVCLCGGFIVCMLIFPETQSSAPHILPRGIDISTLNASEPRLELWGLALKNMLQYPYLGTGPGSYPLYAFAAKFLNATTHNAPLMLLSEWGIPATIIVVLLVIYGFIHIFRSTYSTYKILLLASFVSGATHSFFSGINITPIGQTFTALVLGMLIFSFQRKTFHDKTSNNKKNNGKLPATKNIIFIASILIAFFMAANTYFALSSLPKYESSLLYQKKCHHYIGPNFWYLGQLTPNSFYPSKQIKCPIVIR